MKFSANQSELLTAVGAVKAVVTRAATLPVLRHVLLSVERGTLRVAATDLEKSLQLWIPARVDEEGAVALPARQLLDYLNALPPSEVHVELNPKTTTAQLMCANHRAHIKGVDVSEFPVLVTRAECETEAQEILIDADVFAAAVGATEFAAAKDGVRPALRGIHLHARADTKHLQFNSVDGFRLSRYDANVLERVAAGFDILLPAEGMRIAAKLSATQEAPVALFVPHDRKRVVFVFENALLALAAIEDKFPDTNGIIPKSSNFRFKVAREDLLRDARAALVFARDNHRRINFEFADETIAVSARADSGDTHSVLGAWREGTPHPISLSAAFLQAALVAVEASEVEFSDNGAETPVVVRSAQIPAFTHVIMPMAQE